MVPEPTTNGRGENSILESRPRPMIVTLKEEIKIRMMRNLYKLKKF